MSNLRHFDNLGTVRFVTFSCYRRLPGFIDEKSKGLFIRHLEMAREKHKFKLFGYVIMPEHVHLVILPGEDTKLGLLIREIKSKMAREYFSEISTYGEQKKHIFWQKRCYDHNCRTRETVIEKIEYCHKNPVVRGLVDSPDKWEYSSYNFYSGKINVPIIMDKLEI
jgi:putative transposase